MKRYFATLVGVILLPGCAGTTPMALGPGHPASPDAPVAPAPPPSLTLAVSSPPTTLPSRSAGTTAPSHAGHPGGHGDHARHAEAGDAPATTRTGVEAMYTCPMHPEVVSNRPGVCPKCDMKLVKKGGTR